MITGLESKVKAATAFEEKCRKAIDYDEQVKKFMRQAAVFHGPRLMDKRYTQIIQEAMDYNKQFTTDELPC